MNIFKHEDQLALKAKIESFIGKPIQNFLGSPHMHIFKDIFDKLEEIGQSPKEQAQVVKVIDDAKNIDINKLKQEWNNGPAGIVTVASEVNTVVSDVENLKGELANGNELPSGEADTGKREDTTVHAAATTESAGSEPTATPAAEQPTDAATTPTTEPANG